MTISLSRPFDVIDASHAQADIRIEMAMPAGAVTKELHCKAPCARTQNHQKKHFQRGHWAELWPRREPSLLSELHLGPRSNTNITPQP
jgi:hypothetical protein